MYLVVLFKQYARHGLVPILFNSLLFDPIGDEGEGVFSLLEASIDSLLMLLLVNGLFAHFKDYIF